MTESVDALANATQETMDSLEQWHWMSHLINMVKGDIVSGLVIYMLLPLVRIGFSFLWSDIGYLYP